MTVNLFPFQAADDSQWTAVKWMLWCRDTVWPYLCTTAEETFFLFVYMHSSLIVFISFPGETCEVCYGTEY